MESIKCQIRSKAYLAIKDKVLNDPTETDPPPEDEDPVEATATALPILSPSASALKNWLTTYRHSNNPSDEFEQKLHDAALEATSGNVSSATIESILSDIPKKTARPRLVRPPNGSKPKDSRRRQRRRDYARIQQMLSSRPKEAARIILDGEATGGDRPTDECFRNYWGPVFSEPSAPAARREPGNRKTVSNRNLLGPVSEVEIKANQLNRGSACGPDLVTVEAWQSIAPSARAAFYNICLCAGELPPSLNLARTVFIPKKDNPSGPGDFRPLSMTSVITRQLHKILAARLTRSINLNERQRAFLPVDGVAENTMILDTIIATAREQLKELHIATLDVAKAFDSVSHFAIFRALRRIGCPEPFVQYVEAYYSHASTVIGSSSDESQRIPVNRGVRQGDPLSPIIFNIIMDELLDSLPADIGFSISGTQINCLAFADDLVLVASSQVGLQMLLNLTSSLLETTGMLLNESKCSAFSLKPSGREKKYKVITHSLFTINDKPVKQTGVTETWRYLGLHFAATGKQSNRSTLELMLSRLAKAPLKPQQRLNILKVYVVPRLLGGLVLGRTSAKRLGELDIKIRSFVRNCLRLPKDLPLGAFYAPVKEGGLGLTALLRSVPAMRLVRTQRLATSKYSAAKAVALSQHVQRQIRWASQVLQTWGPQCTDNSKVKREWSRRLHESVDGVDLRHASEVPASSDWSHVTRSSSEFIQTHQVRFNALPSKARTSRGPRRENSDASCRAGCQVLETTAHVIQQCHRSHGGRIARHDRICKMICKELEGKGFIVQREPVINIANGTWKPDIVISKDGKVTIIDAQIRSGSMDECHKQKRAKYAQNRLLLRAVSDRAGAIPDAFVTTATISWRGVWSKSSAMDLTNLGCSKYLLTKITWEVLKGSYLCWTRFNQMTTMRF